MPPSSTNDIVMLGEEEIPSTNTTKYLGTISAAQRRTEGNCKNRVRLSWNTWRETMDVCDKKLPVDRNQTCHAIRCRILGHDK